MRIWFFLLLLLAAIAPCAAVEDTLDSLKARVDHASPDERSQIALKIAQMQLRNADRFYIEGRIDEARAAVEDVATYSEKARDSAIQAKKREKNLEIEVRKMSERLRDIKRTLAFEDQAPLDQAIRRLEDVRTTLLNEMFSKKKDK
jgi:uncharacterized protein YdaU (DUF1376 family)